MYFMIFSFKFRLFLVFICFFTAILVGCSDSDIDIEGPLVISKTIGTAGGNFQNIAVTGGNMTVDIPAGALAVDTNITVTPLSVADYPAPVPASKVYVGVTFAPTGTIFAAGKPAVVTFPLATAKTAGLKLSVLLWNPMTLKWDIDGEATVNADGMSASANITHFSTYVLVDSSGTLLDTNSFMLGSGKIYTPSPYLPDIKFNGSAANNSASLLFNCPIQKVSSSYNTLTQAPSGTYTSNQTYAVGSETLSLAVGNVFVGSAKKYGVNPLAPPTTFYFKLRIIAISYPNETATMIFEYETIMNPLNVNPG
jgi:hypothetical protein